MYRTLYSFIIAFTITVWCCFLRSDAAANDESKHENDQSGDASSVEHYLAKAKEHEEAGKYKRAFKYYKKVEKKTVPLVNKASAIVAQGRCLERLSNPWKAYLQYRKALDEYSTFIPFMDVVKQEYKIANDYFSGEKEKFLFFSVSTGGKAIEIYDHIAQVAPYAPFTVDAIYRSGLLSIKIKNYDDAAERFRLIISRYSSSDKVEDAKIELTNALLRNAARADSDGKLVEQSYRVLSTINYGKLSPQRAEDAKALLHTARSLQAERLLYLAEFYQREAHMRNDASKRYLSQVLEEYQDTASVAPANELLSTITNQKSPDSNQVEN